MSDTPEIFGPLWDAMHTRPRLAASLVQRPDISTKAGVYAWYRDGQPVYVGRALAAGGLRKRVWGNHLRIGPDLSKSAFRRNVTEHLGIAPTSVTRAGPLPPDQVDIVNAWVATCEVAWIECATRDEAEALETAMKAEWKPPLTKR